MAEDDGAVDAHAGMAEPRADGAGSGRSTGGDGDAQARKRAEAASILAPARGRLSLPSESLAVPGPPPARAASKGRRPSPSPARVHLAAVEHAPRLAAAPSSDSAARPSPHGSSPQGGALGSPASSTPGVSPLTSPLAPLVRPAAVLLDADDVEARLARLPSGEAPGHGRPLAPLAADGARPHRVSLGAPVVHASPSGSSASGSPSYRIAGEPAGRRSLPAKLPHDPNLRSPSASPGASRSGSPVDDVVRPLPARPAGLHLAPMVSK